MGDWNERYLSMAALVASWSKDPSTQVGAVITRPNNTVVSVGYNGFARGVDDSPDRLADRDVKLACTIHAEMNAILNAREGLDGCTIFVTHPPCGNCAASIINVGIREVKYKRPNQDLLSRWGESIGRALGMFREAGVKVSSLA